MQLIETLNEDNWEDRVLRTSCEVLVDFEAPWFRTSLMEELQAAEVFERWEGMLVVGRVDTSLTPALAIRYRIHDLPSLALFKKGRLVGLTSGPHRVREMAQRIFSQKGWG